MIRNKQDEIEQRLRAAVRSAPEATVITDARRVIDFLNAPTERLFGYTADELVGRRIETLIPDRFRPSLRGHVAEPKVRLISSGWGLWGRRKDGTEFPVEVSLVPVESGDGDLLVLAVRDISARKREELRARIHAWRSRYEATG